MEDNSAERVSDSKRGEIGKRNQKQEESGGQEKEKMRRKWKREMLDGP